MVTTLDDKHEPIPDAGWCLVCRREIIKVNFEWHHYDPLLGEMED
jgi:hypothetical protein